MQARRPIASDRSVLHQIKGGEQQPQPGDNSWKKQADGITGKNKEFFLS
jgi:hypothetical protein